MRPDQVSQRVSAVVSLLELSTSSASSSTASSSSSSQFLAPHVPPHVSAEPVGEESTGDELASIDGEATSTPSVRDRRLPGSKIDGSPHILTEPMGADSTVIDLASTDEEATSTPSVRGRQFRGSKIPDASPPSAAGSTSAKRKRDPVVVASTAKAAKKAGGLKPVDVSDDSDGPALDDGDSDDGIEDSDDTALTPVASASAAALSSSARRRRGKAARFSTAKASKKGSGKKPAAPSDGFEDSAVDDDQTEVSDDSDGDDDRRSSGGPASGGAGHDGDSYDAHGFDFDGGFEQDDDDDDVPPPARQRAVPAAGPRSGRSLDTDPVDTDANSPAAARAAFQIPGRQSQQLSDMFGQSAIGLVLLDFLPHLVHGLSGVKEFESQSPEMLGKLKLLASLTQGVSALARQRLSGKSPLPDGFCPACLLPFESAIDQSQEMQEPMLCQGCKVKCHLKCCVSIGTSLICMNCGIEAMANQHLALAPEVRGSAAASMSTRRSSTRRSSGYGSTSLASWRPLSLGTSGCDRLNLAS